VSAGVEEVEVGGGEGERDDELGCCVGRGRVGGNGWSV